LFGCFSQGEYVGEIKRTGIERICLPAFRTGEYVGEIKRTGIERIGGRFQE